MSGSNQPGQGSKSRILVPTDFTEVVDYAMDHAMKLAHIMGAEVHLLHIVPDLEEEAVMQRRMEAEKSRCQAVNARVPLFTMVRQGKIYAGIGDAAEEIGAELIIMGTHGMRGMQFITGSRALRVITNSKVPFIVVQERGMKAMGYRDILVPMDLQRETRQSVALVAGMAAYFKSKVHVIVPRESDELLRRKLKENILFATKYFEGRGIAMEAVEAEGKGFVQAVMDHARTIDADLIAVMNMVGTNIFGVLGVPYEEEIITNEAKIPVMMVNPIKDTLGGGGWSFQ
jgi:nucleotide-binding universal stress UspA family protein